MKRNEINLITFSRYILDRRKMVEIVAPGNLAFSLFSYREFIFICYDDKVVLRASLWELS